MSYLDRLTDIFRLVANLPLDEEDRYWKLYRIKTTINWIRNELGMESLKFKKGTNQIIGD